MTSEKRGIAKDTFFYTISQIISQGIGFVTSIVIRNALGPLFMGIWSALRVVLDYTQYSGLGMTSAAYCEIPYLKGAGKLEEAEKVKNLTFTFTMVVSSFIAIMIFVSSFFLAKRYEPYVINGLRVVALGTILTFLYSFLSVILRAEKKFVSISKAMVLNAALALIFAVTLVTRYKIYGMYAGFLLALVTTSIFILVNDNIKFRFYFNTKHLMKLMAIGLPLFFNGIFYIIYISSDKILILKLIGTEALGYYSLAMLVSSTIDSFPRLFGIVIFPRAQEKYGEVQSYEYIKKYVEKPTKLFFYMSVIFLGYAYFAISGLVPYIMPKFTPGILSAKILLCGVIIFMLIVFSETFIVVIRKQLYLIPILLISTAIGITASYILIKKGFGISGVSAGMSVSYIMYFIIVSGFATGHFWKIRDAINFYKDIFIPYVYVLMALVFIETLFIGKQGIGTMFKEFVLYAIFSVPIVVLAHKKGYFKEILSLIKK